MATKRKKKKIKRKSAGINLIIWIYILGILGLFFTIYIGYRASIADRKLFSVSMLALFAGLLFESFRISTSWKNVVFTFLGSYFFSLAAFLPGKEAIYSFENHIEWDSFMFQIANLTTNPAFLPIDKFSLFR